MSTLLVLKFDTVGGAAQMRDRMLALQKQQLITVEDAAIMWRDTDGKPKLTQLNDMAGVGALGGAFWGMLFGLLFFIPVLGLAVGAAMGAIAGSMSDVGIDDKFIKQVGESITPGTSALFLLTSHAVLDKVLEQTKDLKYEMLQSNLSQAMRTGCAPPSAQALASAPAVTVARPVDTATWMTRRGLRYCHHRQCYR